MKLQKSPQEHQIQRRTCFAPADIPRSDADQGVTETTQFPEFSYSQFEKLKRENPKQCFDIFGNGKLVIQLLQPGSKYPDTDAPLLVSYSLKQLSDEKILQQDQSCKISPQDDIRMSCNFTLLIMLGIELLFWTSKFLRIGGEALVYSSCEYGFLVRSLHSIPNLQQCGIPGFIGPNESLLGYVKLLSAAPYQPAKTDVRELEIILILQENPLSIDQMITNAMQHVKTGDDFFGRGILKLALDCYTRASRILQKNSRVFLQ